MRSGKALIVVGVVILVVGAIIAVVLWRAGGQQPPPAATNTPPGPGEATSVPFIPPAEGMKTIVVAAQDIPRGTLITEYNNAVKSTSWPETAVPDEVVTDLDDVYGTVARIDIVREMPILEGMVSAEAGDVAELGSDAALMIPPGRVAYAFSVGGNAAVAWAIEPGDHVDVLMSLLFIDIDEEFQTALPNWSAEVGGVERRTTDAQGNILVHPETEVGRQEELPDGTVVLLVPGEGSQRPRMVTQLTVQDAIVLRVGTWREEPAPAEEVPAEEGAAPTPAPSPEAQWLTVAVTPQDAAVLKYGEELGASMDLVLRSASDKDGALVATEAVTLQYIFDRFDMEVPDRLPYGVSPGVVTLRAGAAGEVSGGQDEPSRRQ
jgi:Flp pilus assembly protein CpaB